MIRLIFGSKTPLNVFRPSHLLFHNNQTFSESNSSNNQSQNTKDNDFQKNKKLMIKLGHKRIHKQINSQINSKLNKSLKFNFKKRKIIFDAYVDDDADVDGKSAFDLKKFSAQLLKRNDKQKTQQDTNKGNFFQNIKKILIRSSLLGFLFLILGSDTNDTRSKSLTEHSEFQSVLNQIKNAAEPPIINVIKRINSVIVVKVRFSFLKTLSLKLSQKKLVLFLEKLEEIHNGDIQVSFQFINPPFQSIDYPKIITFFFWGFIIMITTFVLRKNFSSASNQVFKQAIDKFKPVPLKPDQIDVKFSDVAGLHEAKFQITQFVDFLRKPDRYLEMGAKIPKGAVLTGPPGTGKTLLAKACAGEASVPFYSMAGSQFIQKYAGLGASRVRTLFQEAEKNSPSIIFIDEIDAIGKKRGSGPFSNEERNNTLNQLLVCMDGFKTQNKVIVMAATNRKDMLDPALLRPGRFDRSVEIGLPNAKQREQILKVHLKKYKFDPSLTIDELAKKISVLTPGFSGDQLATTCNQASILAARKNLPHITLSQYEKATERTMAGLEKRNLFSDEEKQALAYYECGKAIANWFTRGADPVIKISILPFSRSKAGFSHSIKDQTGLQTKQELLAKAVCLLAGRSSQLHFKGYMTTNGHEDLQRAKRIISAIVMKFGMVQSLKMIAFPDVEYTRKPYSEKTEAIIDEQIDKITRWCQQEVDKLIVQKKELILTLKQEIINKQILTHNDLKKILGERPFTENENYQEFLKDQAQKQKKQAEKHEQGPGVKADVQ